MRGRGYRPNTRLARLDRCGDVEGGMGSVAEEPMFRRLSAGGRWIRTIGPRVMGGDSGRRVPAAIAVFELASTADVIPLVNASFRPIAGRLGRNLGPINFVSRRCRRASPMSADRWQAGHDAWISVARSATGAPRRV